MNKLTVTLKKNRQLLFRSVLLITLLFISFRVLAQGEARVSARISTHQITVGDQARVFLEAQHNPTQNTLQWAELPDSLGKLEIVERGKIDTVKDGNIITYKQRLLITGFDSGIFQVPSFVFSVIPKNGGNAYTLHSDSFQILVQTVPVDTTKAFKPIKGILFVKTTWIDYLLYIVIGVIIAVAAILVIIYFIRRRKLVPAAPPAPPEPLFDKTIRLLNELEAKQLWQKDKIKEYYVELTDIVRSYIEVRFNTPAPELTTDEFLTKAYYTKELQPYHLMLSDILHTADLAKFAKAQPLPQEHMDALDKAKQFVITSKPIEVQPIKETTI